jgi:hypothetical protein
LGGSKNAVCENVPNIETSLKKCILELSARWKILEVYSSCPSAGTIQKGMQCFTTRAFRERRCLLAKPLRMFAFPLCKQLFS